MDALLHYLLLAPPILLALTVHEYAHALVAYRLGDDTAQKLGRLTLNPLVHLDLLGTVMLFVVQLGWAKPVPVNPDNFKNPRKGMLFVALAGPISNILLAAAFGVLLRLSVLVFDSGDAISSIAIGMFKIGITINLLLAFFNLLPIPPLDGSKVLFSFIPPRFDNVVRQFSTYGPLLLLLLIIVGNRTDISVIWSLIGPPVRFLSGVFGSPGF